MKRSQIKAELARRKVPVDVDIPTPRLEEILKEAEAKHDAKP
jgi:hypothetical protein